MHEDLHEDPVLKMYYLADQARYCAFFFRDQEPGPLFEVITQAAEVSNSDIEREVEIAARGVRLATTALESVLI